MRIALQTIRNNPPINLPRRLFYERRVSAANAVPESRAPRLLTDSFSNSTAHLTVNKVPAAAPAMQNGKSGYLRPAISNPPAHTEPIQIIAVGIRYCHFYRGWIHCTRTITEIEKSAGKHCDIGAPRQKHKLPDYRSRASGKTAYQHCRRPVLPGNFQNHQKYQPCQKQAGKKPDASYCRNV